MSAANALDSKKKEKIKSLLALGKSKNTVAKEAKVSWSTVDKVSKEGPDELESLRERKKAQLIEKMWENIESAQELGFQMIQQAKTGQRDIPLGQISTYLGTIYDKRALMLGESTNNTEMRVVIDGELDEWAN